jgi:hypothetical protein
MGLPDTRFYLDDGTGTFPKDITSKVLLLNGMTIKRGREDWQGGVTAGELSITLNNADGRFTPGSTILGTPSPIKVDQRIRVKETVNGVAFTRFTGYVKSWPVSWPATVSTFAQVRLTSTDAQARAERWPLLPVMQQEVSADTPVAQYTLAEPAGVASAADSSGNQAPELVPRGSGSDVVFGSAEGPPSTGLTAAQFAGGKYLSTGTSFNIAAGAVECWFRPTSDPTYVRPIIALRDEIVTNLSVFVAMANTTLVVWKPGTGALSLTTLTDGSLHHLVVTAATGTTHVYLDGALVLDDPGLSSTIGALAVGGHGGPSSPESFIGSVSNIAVYSSGLSAGRIAAHYAAGFTASESGTARITRLAGYASLPVGSLDTSLTNVAYTDIADKSAWEAIQQAADAEVGTVFFDGSGNLRFHNRNRVSSKTSPDLTLVATGVTPDVQPVDDDQQIVNYIGTTSEITQVTQVVKDATSEGTHGRYPSSASYLVETDQEALDRANWIVTNFAEPTTRYGTLTINLYGMTAAQQATVLTAIEINAWLRITSMPSQNTGGTTVDVVVQGYTEQQGGDTWTIQCNVVARSIFNALILDNSTYGVLDSAAARLYV